MSLLIRCVIAIPMRWRVADGVGLRLKQSCLSSVPFGSLRYAVRLRLLLVPGVVAALVLSLGAAPAPADSCPNAQFRIGPSASLPDCRAYELVTPPDTNGQTPRAGDGRFHLGLGEVGNYFDTSPASPGGNRFLFTISQTVLPGFDGNGAENSYVAERDSTGWSIRSQSPTGAQASGPSPGGATADFGYQQWSIEGTGTLALMNNDSWLRYPDGSFHPVGEGTIPAAPDTDGYLNGFQDDLMARLDYMTGAGDHQIFETVPPFISPGPQPQQLTADAPPTGTTAVYDRSPSSLHVVSLLPGNVTPTTNSSYDGASADGSVVVFHERAGSLYARIDDSATQLVASGDFTNSDLFGGATDSRVFYAHAGNLFVYDLGSEQTTQITSSGDATFVRVSGDGSHVFFTSPSQLDGSQGVAGGPNLYDWDGQAIHFIATVRSEDFNVDGFNQQGLTYWAGAVAGRRTDSTVNTSRATPNGSVFLFLSSADPTGQNPDHHFEIYRYVSATGQLDCVSCPPDGSPATADARLAQNVKLIANDFTSPSVVGSSTIVPNVTDDGHTVFFESDQDLLPADSDGVSSVYEWRAGRLYLLSSGQSSLGDHLMGMTPDGSEVFIETPDQLVPQAQQAGVPGIYAARVHGGFPPPPTASACSGDTCRGSGGTGTAPPAPVAGTIAFAGPGDPAPSRADTKTTGKLTVRVRSVHAPRFTLEIKVPGAGAVAVRGARVKRVTTRPAKAATLNVTLHLKKATVRLLRQAKTVKVPLVVSFTPKSGTPSSKRITVIVKRPKAKARGVNATRRAGR